MDEEGEDAGPAWDLNSIKEEEFERHVVYIVPDLPVNPASTNRAESSLPRNLVLKPSQALNDVSTLLSYSGVDRGGKGVSRGSEDPPPPEIERNGTFVAFG